MEGTQSQSNATLSLVLQALNGISDSLEELAGKASSVVPSAFLPLEDFYNEFLNDFRSRWYDQDKSVDRKYFIAALLDPRIKRDYLCKFELEGQKLLKEYLKEAFDQQKRAGNCGVAPVPMTQNPLSWMQASSITQSDELESYWNSFQILGMDANVWEWWRLHKAIYPVLFQLARRILAIPASSSCVERNFSRARVILNERNNKLDRNIGSCICFLALNRPYWGIVLGLSQFGDL